jgi:hypothetical protein
MKNLFLILGLLSSPLSFALPTCDKAMISTAIGAIVQVPAALIGTKVSYGLVSDQMVMVIGAVTNSIIDTEQTLVTFMSPTSEICSTRIKSFNMFINLAKFSTAESQTRKTILDQCALKMQSSKTPSISVFGINSSTKVITLSYFDPTNKVMNLSANLSDSVNFDRISCN